MRRRMVTLLLSLALLPAMVFGAFPVAALGQAYAYRVESLQVARVTTQEVVQDALLDSDGLLYPANASGKKIATSWAGYAYTNDKVQRLFIAADVSALSSTAVIPLNVGSQMTVNVRGLTKLAEVVFLLDPATGKNACKSIPRLAFKGCSSLVALTNLEATSLTSIGDRAFEKCTALTGAITLPDTCNRIGAQAFYYCKRITGITAERVDLKVGDQAFERCTSLATLSFSGVKAVGASAFQRCSSLKKVVFPATCVSIGNGAFSDCSALSVIDFTKSDSLKTIGAEAFRGCSAKSVSLPNTCVKIGESAFAKCKKLAKFTGGTGLRSVGARAFEACSKLSKATFKYKKKIVSAGSYLFRKTKISAGKGRVIVPEKLLESYLAKAAKAKKSSAWRGCKFKALAS